MADLNVGDSAEIWKPIEGFDGMYEVSNTGRVRSRRRRGGGGNPDKWRIMSGSTTQKGYRSVLLMCDGRRTRVEIHTLVARAFIGPRPDGMQVNHKDLCGTNNHVSNLEYVTPRQNTIHGIRGRNTSNATSEYIGVCWNKAASKWQASIKVRGKSNHLGVFDSERDAAMAYDRAAIEMHGPRAFLNILDHPA